MHEPTEIEIQETIAMLQARLAEPGMSKAVNTRVRHGYNKAVDILAQNQRDYRNGGPSGIEKLQTTQARAIAMLAVDYLNGECEQKVLVNVPIKGQQTLHSVE
ncbi:MAG: hypothetical protein JWP57_2057 [Spirosoma sp.]|nr:hypothetical protein [Spirosoma sp.]